MKIALIAHCLHPIREPFEGGLEMITFLLCRSLMERGHEVHLYAHEDSDKRFHIRPIPLNAPYPGELLKGMSEVGHGIDMVRETLAYVGTMNEIATGGYDIVHNHSLHYIPIIMGNILGVPMVTSIHTPEFPFLQLGAYGVKNYTRQTFTMVSKSLAKSWNKLVPISTVVHNGIDVDNWAPVDEPHGDYVFWGGRICSEKGTHLAIKAAVEACKPIKLVGPISNRDYFDTYVKPLLNSKGVDYLGHIDQGSMGPLMANAAAMLFTSTWEEPYGLTLAESLACGTPVIAFEGGAVREILTDTTGIIVPKYDIEGMSKAISSVSGLSRDECRKRAVDFCSHHRMVEGYLDLYNRLLEHHEYEHSLSQC